MKLQAWHFFITDSQKKRCVAKEKILFSDPKTVIGRINKKPHHVTNEPLNELIYETRVKVFQQGLNYFLCSIINDSYVGFDHEIAVSIVAEEKNTELVEYSSEDIEAVNRSKQRSFSFLKRNRITIENPEESDGDEEQELRKL